jgi:hypothetical protein
MIGIGTTADAAVVDRSAPVRQPPVVVVQIVVQQLQVQLAGHAWARFDVEVEDVETFAFISIPSREAALDQHGARHAVESCTSTSESVRTASCRNRLREASHASRRNLPG